MRSMILSIVLPTLMLLVPADVPAQKQVSNFDHSTWNTLLQKNVSADGKVNYVGFKDDLGFQRYLGMLSKFAPSDAWTNDQKMAYWINAYNAYTVKLVIDNLPLNSIRDIGEPWKKEIAQVGGRTYSLDHIEHQILRKEFNDPRIHFAINCASFSCPVLSSKAYLPETLNAQLEAAARKFINDVKRNNITASKAQISSLFDWFKEDFTKSGGVIQYLQKYVGITIDPKAEISYLEYNWSLNN